MEAITVSIQNLIEESQNASLKASKTVLASLPLSGYKDHPLQDTLAACQKAKTKADFTKHLSLALTCLNNSLAVADDNIKDQREQITDTRELDDLALSIREGLAYAQKSFFYVGKLLKQARDTILAEEGAKSEQFIVWAKENCGIVKAQAYKLIKVYDTFGDESDFAGVSMRVLYALTSQSDEIIEKARTLAQAGTLDTKALDNLLATPKTDPKPPAPKPPAPKPPEGDHIKTKREFELEKQIEDLKRENAIMKDQDTQDVKDQNDALASYRKQVEELNITIQLLNERLEKAEKAPAKAVPQVPFLPQFNSLNPCTVLGLEPEKAGDKQAVNKAFRELAKIYTSVSCKEGSEKIIAARDSLLK